MRLIIPLVIIVLGACVGIVINTILNGREDASDVAPWLSMVAGAFGGFAGMLLRDALGIHMIGNLTDTWIASVAGAAIFAAVAHIVLRTRS